MAMFISGSSSSTASFASLTLPNNVLKENLLTNSGFDVWSNGSLENATGTKLHPTSTCTDPDSDTDSTSGWSAHNGSALTSEESVAGFSGSVLKVLDQSGADGSANFTATTVVGKLYKLVFTQKNGDNRGFVTVGNQSNDYDGDVYKILDNASATAYTIVFEASFTTTYVTLGSIDDYDYCYFNDVSLYEVTPGCVGGNTKAPDDWYKIGATTCQIYREHSGSFTTDGSFYSLKAVTTAVQQYIVHNYSQSAEEHVYTRFRGRTCTMGAWVKTSNAGVRVIIGDNSGETASTAHGAGGGWEWLEVTKTFADNITRAYFGIRNTTTANTTFYMSQPIAVFGSSIGEGNYTRPNTEIIYLEGECALEDFNASTFTTGDNPTVNLESESRGKLPKTTKAIVNARCTAKDSGTSSSSVVGYFYPGSGYENGIGFNIGNTGLTLANDDDYMFNMSYMKTVNAGFTTNLTASGTDTLEIDIWVRAIEI